ncbi:MAG: hypothetical protein HHJ16_16055 [Polaromonas sp.]|uniref:hypothetical protein n=1 Tax=Polaromonas sp. TaxID=1869339 RepID=UPI00180D5D41|nr:hypothetical protein [Polaromonas sp.]NMM11769.1 hypothetical protein [Polaromonas sp.]
MSAPGLPGTQATVNSNTQLTHPRLVNDKLTDLAAIGGPLGHGSKCQVSGAGAGDKF